MVLNQLTPLLPSAASTTGLGSSLRTLRSPAVTGSTLPGYWLASAHGTRSSDALATTNACWLGLLAAATSAASRRRRQRSQPFEGAIPRHGKTRNLPDYAFDRLYKPESGLSDEPGYRERIEQMDANNGSAQGDDGSPKSRRRNEAPWKRRDREILEDASRSVKQVIERQPLHKNHKAYGKRWTVYDGDNMKRRAWQLRSIYKRPRFGWKEVMEKDSKISMEDLSGDMPAIGSGEVWLSKFLAHSGACSRRAVTELVLQGRVTINGEIAKEVTRKIDPKKDSVCVDGKAQNLRTLDEIVWVMLNKPKDYITSLTDPAGRKTVMDLIPFAKKRRLTPIGRLDRNSTGLLLLTNDYEWNTILSHPRYTHTKRYKVDIYNGSPSLQKLQVLKNGLDLPDEPRPLLPLQDIQIEMTSKVEEICTITFSLNEGKYRQIRRMFEYIGHPVKKIKRIQYGLLKLDRELKFGEWRMLSPKEIRRLKGPTILARPKPHPFDSDKVLEAELRDFDQEQYEGGRSQKSRYENDGMNDREWDDGRRQGGRNDWDGVRSRERSRRELLRDEDGLRANRRGDRQGGYDRGSQSRGGSFDADGRSYGEDSERSRGSRSRGRSFDADGRSYDENQNRQRSRGRRQDRGEEPLGRSGDAGMDNQDWEESWVNQLDAMKQSKSR
eukprot:TRINITY_DN15366_c0_g2_i1.p1 TRINITY_DN15366_c0_g2~~TRINITY_DN15366_c0_g2_i1.p1  ORF type:complete len:666 (+),score=103.55 TRINITY_DN15366_c0_g2_i1:101-2098(+)